MSKIRIEEMTSKVNIEDTDLIIVEDSSDTKQSTVRELKHAFNGDANEASEYRFYSSKKVDDLINGLEMSIAHLPSASEFSNMYNQIKNITGSTGSGKDTELVAARGEYATLSDRLAGDRSEYENMFLKYPTHTFAGISVDLTDYSDIETMISVPAVNTDTTIEISSANMMQVSDNLDYANVTKSDNNGYDIVYTGTSYNYDLPVSPTISAGDYIFYANSSFSSDYIKEGTRFVVVYTDNSVVEYTYGYTKIFRFNATKPVKAIRIVPNVGTIVSGMVLHLDEIMLSDIGSLKTYCPYYREVVSIAANTATTLKRTLNQCRIRRISSGIVNVTVIDNNYNAEYIQNEIENIKAKTIAQEDYCGLIDEVGTYYYADNIIVNNEELCTCSTDSTKMRNNHSSTKITLGDCDPDVDPTFTMILDNVLDLSNNYYISLQIYIDKEVSERFTEIDGIKIMLSSDSTIANPCVNYYYFNIGKNSFVQGWNTIKIKLSDFMEQCKPDIANITQINFRVHRTEFNEGKCFWINSIIIDQKMKPTILLAFDDLQEDGFDYLYPYLYSRDIPATIFANDKQTMTTDYLNKVGDLIYKYGWDFGNYGCNPNKEKMIEDDNAREQYLAVKNTRQWIYDTLTDNVIAYAAPFGNLRTISEPVLKRLGFKIAKTSADQYCSFFSKQDFAIPMHLLSNKENMGADEMIKKIDEIVETGQCLCIYTGGVSKYGSEIAATRTSFEYVIEHILDYKNSGALQVLTFSDFYNKCVK